MFPKILLIDNYDSFTYNLYDYFKQLSCEVLVKKNDEISVEEAMKIDFSHLVFSPGPKTPAEAGSMMELLDAFHTTKPILGICLGHQAIGLYFGATLKNAVYPMHGKTSLVFHNQSAVFKNVPSPFQVMRYHSLILENVTNPIQIIAETATNEVMMIQHETLPILGIQFHPESILTPDGILILKNWIYGN